MHEDTSRDSETQKMKFVSQGLFREKSNTSFLSFGLMRMSRIAQTAFFFFCFPHRPLQFENKITLMTLLCSLLFFLCLCLKKRHIIIAAFYSKEQKIKRAINDLSDLAPTPVCLFVSHRPKNICHFSPASPTLHFSFYHSSISLLSDTQTVHVQAYTNAHA